MNGCSSSSEVQYSETRNRVIQFVSILVLLSYPTESFSVSSAKKKRMFRGEGRSSKTKLTSTITSTCACGLVSLEILDLTHNSTTTAVDCHCPKCRSYHAAAFVSYLVVSESSQIRWRQPHDNSQNSNTSIRIYRDQCFEISTNSTTAVVERLFCSECCTKMASRIITTTDNDESPPNLSFLVNMGPLDDDTIPESLATQWQNHREQWQLDQKPKWPEATTTNTKKNQEVIITGGCGCGAHQYRLIRPSLSEQQHCYCRLCRQFTGSAFQTWVPVSQFSWITSPEPELVPTTEFGRRHMCSNCGGVFTIVYDNDNDMIWPAAGSFHDNQEESSDVRLNRVVHIGCAWKQSWYTIPNDGMPRIDFAS